MTRWWIGVLFAGSLGAAGLAAQVAPAAAPPARGEADSTRAAPTATSRPAVSHEDFWDRAARGVPRRQPETSPQAPGSSMRDMFRRDRELEVPGPSMPSTPRIEDAEPSQDRRSRNWLAEAFEQAEQESRRGGRDRDRDRERDRDRDRERQANPFLSGERDTSPGSGERLSLADLVRREESRQREADTRRQDRERESARQAEQIAMEGPPSGGDTSSASGTPGAAGGAAGATASAEDPARLFAEGDALSRLHQRLLFGSDSAAEAARSRSAAAAMRDNPYLTGPADGARSRGSDADAAWSAAAAVASRGTADAGAGRFRSLEAEDRSRRAVADAAAVAVGDLRPEERMHSHSGPMTPLLPVDIRDPGVSGGWTPPTVEPVIQDRSNYRPDTVGDNQRFFPQLQRF